MIRNDAELKAMRERVKGGNLDCLVEGTPTAVTR